MKEKIKDIGEKIKLSNFSIALFNLVFGLAVVAYLIFAQKIQIAIVVGALVLLLFYIAFISLKKIEIMFQVIEDEELKKELKKSAKNKEINEVLAEKKDSSKC